MQNSIESQQTVAARNRGLSALTEAEIGHLTTLRDAAFDRPGTWAGNILCFHYGLCSPIPSGGEGEAPKSLQQISTSDAPQLHTIRIYPNPSTTWTAIDLALSGQLDNAYVHVLDATGRQVKQLNVAESATQLVLDTRNLAPGLYIVELYNAGQRLHSEQLIIQP